MHNITEENVIMNITFYTSSSIIINAKKHSMKFKQKALFRSTIPHLQKDHQKIKIRRDKIFGDFNKIFGRENIYQPCWFDIQLLALTFYSIYL